MSMWQASIAAGASVAAFMLLRHSYIKYMRQDAPFSEETHPVLKNLRRPVLGCHRGGCGERPANTMAAFQHVMDLVKVARNPTSITTESTSQVKSSDATPAWSPARWLPLPGAAKAAMAEAAESHQEPMEDKIQEYAGPQVIELDIHLSKDGHLVLLHDSTVDSTTDGSGRVADKTLEELRQLDAGFRFSPDGGQSFPFRGAGLQVPTLNEVISLLSPLLPSLVLYLDFKAEAAVGPALQLVAERGLQERVVCGATDWAVNRELMRLKPPCVPATPDERSMTLLFLLFLLGLSWLLPIRHEMVGTGTHHCGVKVLSRSFVEAMHQRQRWVAVFGQHLDHPEGQRECLSCGYDILMTDYPSLLMGTLQKKMD